ncbi:MAG: ribonuclease P protein component [Burkholderiaceae bacterium]
MKKFRTQNFMATKLLISASGDQETAQTLGLQFAVPKKLLKRAVDRNAVRRVGKESWRAVVAGAGRLEGNSAERYQLRIRLLNRPKAFLQWSRPERKRFWRQELDQLLAKVVK